MSERDKLIEQARYYWGKQAATGEAFDIGELMANFALSEIAPLKAEIERLQAVLRRMRIEFTDIRTSRALENIGTLVCNCGNLADAVATMIEAALGGEVNDGE